MQAIQRLNRLHSVEQRLASILGEVDQSLLGVCESDPCVARASAESTAAAISEDMSTYLLRLDPDIDIA